MKKGAVEVEDEKGGEEKTGRQETRGHRRGSDMGEGVGGRGGGVGHENMK